MIANLLNRMSRFQSSQKIKSQKIDLIVSVSDFMIETFGSISVLFCLLISGSLAIQDRAISAPDTPGHPVDPL